MKELMREADIAARETGDTKIRGVHVHRNIGVLPPAEEVLMILENVEKVSRVIGLRGCFAWAAFRMIPGMGCGCFCDVYQWTVDYRDGLCVISTKSQSHNI